MEVEIKVGMEKKPMGKPMDNKPCRGSKRTHMDTPANLMEEMFSSDTPSVGNSTQTDRDTLANNR